MASSDDSRGHGLGGVIFELIKQIVLPGEDDCEQGFGIELKLSDGLDLGQNVITEETGLIDDEDRHLLALRDLNDLRADGFGKPGRGVGAGFRVQGDTDLTEYLEG